MFGAYKYEAKAQGNTPANEMSHPVGLTVLLALGFLAGRVVAAPAPEPRAPAVRFLLICYLISPSERLVDHLGWLWGLRNRFHGLQPTMRNP